MCRTDARKCDRTKPAFPRGFGILTLARQAGIAASCRDVTQHYRRYVASSDLGPQRLSRVGLDNHRDVIERVLRHCGLWEGPIRTLASARAPPGRSVGDPDEPRELQLVLDPEFL